MRLYVLEPDSRLGGNGREGVNLTRDQSLDLARRKLEIAPTEMLAIREARMRADLARNKVEARMRRMAAE